MNGNDIKTVSLKTDFSTGAPVWTISEKPVLSWKIAASRDGVFQKSYRITARNERSETVWDSGEVETSCQSAEWNGPALKSGERIRWQVEITDEQGNRSEPGGEGVFEIPLRDNREWKADWIFHDGLDIPGLSIPSPYFRREFELCGPVRKARLHIAARGLFEAHLNGRKIGNDQFVPGWTDFRKRIQYLTYDVTPELTAGTNCLGAVLGEGWCCGYLTTMRYKNIYHPHPELLARLEIELSDGERLAVVTGKGWKCSTGPIMSSDLYDGEVYDARYEMPGWDRPGFDDSAWREAAVGENAAESPKLVQKSCPPVRKQREIKPVQRLNPAKGIYIWDFGQNLVGWVKLKIRGARGRIHQLNFAEVLDENGMLCSQNYRNALTRDIYITCGDKSEEWEPHFTFHGFRYAMLNGFQLYGTSVDDAELTAVVLNSDLEETAHLETGHEKVNRLWQNIRWSQRGNFLEIPTDCPQRDERLGWLGDIQLFCPTALINMDCLSFLRKWLQDLRDAQWEDGTVPSTAPTVLNGLCKDDPAWADAAVIIPYLLWKYSGSEVFLRENYDLMKRFLIHLRQQAHENGKSFRCDGKLGDWLSPSTIKLPENFFSLAYFIRSCRLFSEAASVLGQTGDRTEYAELAEEANREFRRLYLTGSRINIPTQTAYLMALSFGLLTAEEQERNKEELVRLIRGNGCHPDTGFVGTCILNETLSDCSCHGTALELLLQESFPSWLYPVNQGATTIWERWDSYSKETGIADPVMNSFNHYAYGAVGKWMMDRVGGIRYEYGKLDYFLLADPRLGYCKAELETPHGKASSRWQITPDHQVEWEIAVPPNTAGSATLPGGEVRRVSPGTHRFRLPYVKTEDD